MPKAAPFEAHAARYERWFETHEDAYRAELEALRRLLPDPGDGLEIGVGSGRFAGPLGVRVGLDPADAMLARALDRGISVVKGVAEALPFREAAFDTTIMVTTVCFLDDIGRSIAEAERILRPGGSLVLGYVDRDSPLGRRYQADRAENPFYREAVFVSTDELVETVEAAGFTEFRFVQTVFRPPEEIDATEPVEDGYGEGSFVGLKASR